MNKRILKSISLLLAAVMLFGMGTFVLPTSALGTEVQNVDSSVLPPEHDISVMSFNVLDYDTTNVGYAAPSVRAEYVVETIRKYAPDLIGIQEAADAASANGQFAWDDFMKTELAKLGYRGRQITEEDPTGSNTAVSPKTMTIGAGLMIFWKDGRFTYDAAATDAHGSAQYTNSFSIETASNGTVTGNDSARYYHWVRLTDGEHENQPVFMFNTHFTIDSSNSKLTSAEKSQAGHIMRTAEAATLSAKMQAVAGGFPCFSTGDYNCSFGSSKSDMPDDRMLCNMVEGTGLKDAAMAADHCVMCDAASIIDHVFYKENSNFPVETRAIYDDFNGIQPSDHRAVLSYFKYAAPVSFTAGNYDAEAATFTDTTTAASYSFGVTAAAPYTLVITDEAGQTVSSTVTTNKTVNHFTLGIYLDSVLYSTIDATVRRTDLTAPAITADGAAGAYFGKNAYYVALPASAHNVTVTVRDSAVYRDAACTQAASGAFTNVLSGVTTYYVQTPVGVFPLYLCRETKKAEPNTLYVDDDIASAVGTVAFVSRGDVTLVTAGTDGFSVLQTAADAAAENAVIKVAGGAYDGITTAKSLSVLGNHADEAPFVRKDQSWTPSPRTDETVINGTLLFEKNDDISVTVKGMTFVGAIAYGSVYIGHTGDVTAMTQKTETVLIENNKFLAYSTNTTNASDIFMNNSTLKVGRIANNFFKTTKVKLNTFYKRPFVTRNNNGLIVEANYFADYQTSFYVNPEVGSNRPEAGNCIFTLSHNRFENCGQLSTYVMAVYGTAVCDYKIYCNDFVHCGFFSKSYASPAVCLGFSESSTPTDFNNVSLTVLGNRFISCYKPLELNRNTNSSMHNDMRYADITISQNQFINSSALNIAQTLRMNVRVNPTEYGVVTDWDCGYNYFSSPELNSPDPMGYVYGPSSNGVTGIDLQSAFTPYYTDAVMIATSTGEDAPVQSITVAKQAFDYDGTPHALQLSGAADDAVITYSADPDENRAYRLTPITLTNEGSQTVYFRVERPGYQPYTSSAVLRVTTKCEHQYAGVLSYDVSGHWYECSLCHGKKDFAAHIYDDGTDAVCNECGYNRMVQQTADLFTMKLSPAEIDNSDGKPPFTVKWSLKLGINDSSDYAGAEHDIIVLQYGICCAATKQVLIDYAGGIAPETGKMIRNAFRGSGTDAIDKIYKTSNYRLTGVKEGKLRYAMCYICYEIDGEKVMQFSSVDDASTILGGVIGGTGETENRQDRLED